MYQFLISFMADDVLLYQYATFCLFIHQWIEFGLFSPVLASLSNAYVNICIQAFTWTNFS